MFYLRSFIFWYKTEDSLYVICNNLCNRGNNISRHRILFKNNILLFTMIFPINMIKKHSNGKTKGFSINSNGRFPYAMELVIQIFSKFTLLFTILRCLRLRESKKVKLYFLCSGMKAGNIISVECYVL